MGTSLGQDTRGLLSESTRPAGDQRHLAPKSIPSATSLAVVSAPNFAASRDLTPFRQQRDARRNSIEQRVQRYCCAR